MGWSVSPTGGLYGGLVVQCVMFSRWEKWKVTRLGA